MLDMQAIVHLNHRELIININHYIACHIITLLLIIIINIYLRYCYFAIATGINT